MPRSFPASPKLKRSIGVVEPKVEIVIACEGSRTEPRYFADCVSHYATALVRLTVLERTGVPLTVVKTAVAERQQLLLAVQTGRRRKDPPFTVWAVFDRDEHEIDEAIDLARRNGIRIAFSNPCFELWPLLHLNTRYGSQDGRHAVQSALSAVMPKYHHEKNPVIDFELIKDSVNEAMVASYSLVKARKSEGDDFGCPMTTVGELVKGIVNNGKLSVRRSTG
jgi:RloB-like protein